MSSVGRGFLDWRRAVCESKLPSGTRHVLLVLSLYAPTIGEASFPSLATLSTACGLQEKTVRGHLRRAEKDKWIRREQRFTESGRQTSNVYLMVLPGAGEVGPSRKTPPSPSRFSGGSKKKGSSSTKEEHVLGDLFGDELPPGRVDYTEEFNAVWEIHSKGSKKKAFTEYRRALKEKRVTRQGLSSALTDYVASFRGDFTGCALERWLREDRWNNKLPSRSGSQDEWVEEEKRRWEEAVNGGV